MVDEEIKIAEAEIPPGLLSMVFSKGVWSEKEMDSWMREQGGSRIVKYRSVCV
jgi:hypothetical protein